MDGKIAWGVRKNGKAIGSVFVANSQGDPTSVETITSNFDGISDIAIEDHSAYVIDSEFKIWKFNFDGKK